MNKDYPKVIFTKEDMSPINDQLLSEGMKVFVTTVVAACLIIIIAIIFLI